MPVSLVTIDTMAVPNFRLPLADCQQSPSYLQVKVTNKSTKKIPSCKIP